MNIELHIERLVLDEALLRGERPAAVRLAIERQLQQWLLQPHVARTLPGIGAVATLPHVVLPPPAPSHGDLGSRIASAVQQSLVAGTGAAGAGGRER